jgi:hypothetical protein
MGGPEGLRNAVATIHKAGKRASIYTNGRLVDPASSVPLEDRQTWGVRTSPGADVFQEQYGEVVFDVMCPGAPGWRNLFISKLEYLVKAFDIDGIYIDQVSGCRSLPCYAAGHDHGKPNQAWSCYQMFMEELRRRLAALRPGIFLATEGVNDFLGQYFDSQQAHNDWTTLTRDWGVPLPDLFRTTFPGHLLNVGCITQESSGPFYLKLAHVSGGGYDFGIWDWKEMPESFLEITREVLAWYAEHDSTLRYGQIAPVAEKEGCGWRSNTFTEPSRIVMNAAYFPEVNAAYFPEVNAAYFPEVNAAYFPEMNAAYFSGKNAAHFSETAGAQTPTQCTIRLPLPEDWLVSAVSLMEGPGTAPCVVDIQDGNLHILIEGGSGELAGAAVELIERTH